MSEDLKEKPTGYDIKKTRWFPHFTGPFVPSWETYRGGHRWVIRDGKFLVAAMPYESVASGDSWVFDRNTTMLMAAAPILYKALHEWLLFIEKQSEKSKLVAKLGTVEDERDHLSHTLSELSRSVESVIDLVVGSSSVVFRGEEGFENKESGDMCLTS